MKVTVPVCWCFGCTVNTLSTYDTRSVMMILLIISRDKNIKLNVNKSDGNKKGWKQVRNPDKLEAFLFVSKILSVRI